jgi:hypothetical protein
MRCPTPTRRCGGSGSRSMTRTSNRSGPASSARRRCWSCGALPMLWRERESAVVGLRELGQSLGLGASLAPSGRTWKTMERLVGFGMAHWLPGDELGVRTEVAPLSSRQLARLPEWTRQVHDRLLGTHLDRLALAHTDRTLDPDQSLDTARITARLDHLQHRRPAITRGLGLQP